MKTTLAKLNSGQPVTIVVAGDSNTLVSMNTQGRMNWVGYLTEALWERYGDGLVTMINISRCGFTYRRLAQTVDETVLRWKPDLIICQLWLAGLTADEDAHAQGATAFRDFVARVRQVGKGKIDILVSTPNPRVLCHGHPMPEGAQPGEVWECPEWNSKRNAQLVYLARKSRCDVVDHFSAWKRQVYRFAHPGANPRGLWQRMVDPIHPNALGHLVFFREMASLFDVARHFPWEEPCAQSRTTPR